MRHKRSWVAPAGKRRSARGRALRMLGRQRCARLGMNSRLALTRLAFGLGRRRKRLGMWFQRNSGSMKLGVPQRNGCGLLRHRLKVGGCRQRLADRWMRQGTLFRP